MAFDIKAAKDSGYNDQEISDFLTKNHPEFDVKGAQQAGYSLDEIANKLSAPQPIKPTQSENKIISPTGFFGRNAPMTTKLINSLPNVGKGVVEGGSMETATVNDKGDIVAPPPEPSSVPGSIMLSNGQAKPSFASKYLTPNAENIGRAIGGALPIIASQMVAGVPADIMVLKYGMGPVQAAMNEAGLTMATYEGLRGALQNKKPSETVNNMALGYSAGVPLGAAEYGVGKLANLATKDAPEAIANQYLNTPAKIADSLTSKGQPSLGRKFLDETSFGGSKSKAQVYRDINGQLEDNRMLIQNELQKADAASPVEIANGPLAYGNENYSFTGPQSGGINLDEIRKEAIPLISEQSDIGNKGAVNSIDSLMGNIAPGETIVSNQRAFDLLTKLDAEVNKAYSTIDKNTIPPGTEARAAMANKLRELLRQNVPGASDLLKQNHTLQLAETSLLPQVSGRAPIPHSGGWLKSTVADMVGSRAGLGVARGLDKIGKNSSMVNSAIDSMDNLGLADYMNKADKNGK